MTITYEQTQHALREALLDLVTDPSYGEADATFVLYRFDVCGQYPSNEQARGRFVRALQDLRLESEVINTLWAESQRGPMP